MGVTYITSEQLQDVQRLRDSGASVKQIWEQLAQYNDSYAKGAVDVFRPNSNSWYTVRAIWDATGADMSKFDTVARTHMNQYISMIENSNENERFRLPNSAQIEDSYVKALEKSRLKAHTAIDVVISKIRDVEKDNWPLAWYSTYPIMNLEHERIYPSYKSNLDKVSYSDANTIYKKVSWSVAQQEAQEAYVRADHKLPQVAKDGSWGITPIQGVYFYRNSRTENWAIYDKNGEGVLYLDGHKEQINHSNFRLRPDAQHEFLKDGRWQVVEMSPTQEFSPNLLSERTMTANLYETNSPPLSQSTQPNNNQNPLNQPIAVNASNAEIKDYLFAALMSDDDMRYAAIDSVLQTNVAQDFTQQAQQIAQAYDQQQAQIQQMNNPVHVMKL